MPFLKKTAKMEESWESYYTFFTLHFSYYISFIMGIMLHLFSCVHATLYVTILVGPLVGRYSLLGFGHLELKGEQISVTAPAHPHVTDAAVYTALFF